MRCVRRDEQEPARPPRDPGRQAEIDDRLTRSTAITQFGRRGDAKHGDENESGS